MKEYLIEMNNPEYAQVLQFIMATNVPYRQYLTQVRFMVPDGNINNQFQLRFKDTCPPVEGNDHLFE